MVKAVSGGGAIYASRRGFVNVAFPRCSIPDRPAFSFFLNWRKVNLQCSQVYSKMVVFIYMYVWCSYEFFFGFFSVTGYYRVLSVAPCAVRWGLVHLFYTQSCVSVHPRLLTCPPPRPAPVVSARLLSVTEWLPWWPSHSLMRRGCPLWGCRKVWTHWSPLGDEAGAAGRGPREMRRVLREGPLQALKVGGELHLSAGGSSVVRSEGQPLVPRRLWWTCSDGSGRQLRPAPMRQAGRPLSPSGRRARGLCAQGRVRGQPTRLSWFFRWPWSLSSGVYLTAKPGW